MLQRDEMGLALMKKDWFKMGGGDGALGTRGRADQISMCLYVLNATAYTATYTATYDKADCQ